MYSCAPERSGSTNSSQNSTFGKPQPSEIGVVSGCGVLAMAVAARWALPDDKPWAEGLSGMPLSLVRLPTSRSIAVSFAWRIHARWGAARQRVKRSSIRLPDSSAVPFSIAGLYHRLTAATAGLCNPGRLDNVFADSTGPSTPITPAQPPTLALVPAWRRADVPATFESEFGPHSLARRPLVPACQEVRLPKPEIETLVSRAGPPFYPE